MKILLMITKSETGGAQNVVINLANNLINNNEVIVLADSKGEMWEKLDSKIIKKKVNNIKNSLNPLILIKDIFRINKIVNKVKPDVIHSHSSYMGMIGRIVSFCNKIPNIYTVHGFDTILKRYKIVLSIEKMLAKVTNKIIAVSNYDMENLKTNNISNVDLIYNGINEIYSKSLINKSVLNFIEKNRKKGFKIYITAARLAKPKDPFTIIEILEELEKNKIAIVWFGDGPLAKKCMNRSNVFFAGNIVNAFAYFHYFDGFFLSSNYEGFPISILEALKVGLPVISSNVGGVSEIIEDGKNGFLISNDSNKYINWIEAFSICDKNLMIEYIKKSISSFTIDNMVKKYYRTYEKAINETNK